MGSCRSRLGLALLPRAPGPAGLEGQPAQGTRIREFGIELAKKYERLYSNAYDSIFTLVFLS